MVISLFFRPPLLGASHFIKSNCANNGLIKRLLLKRVQKLVFPDERKMSAYEGDGKTVGFVINKKNAEVLLINGVMLTGFVMASGAELYGSMMLFPHSVISWNVSRAQDISEESLVLLKLLEPKIDILVFGYGNKKDYTTEVKQKFTQICKKLGIRYEALPTEDAVGVYNFLADERRLVAAALIPPTSLDLLKYIKRDNFYLDDIDDDEEEEELKTITSNNVETKLIK